MRETCILVWMYNTKKLKNTFEGGGFVTMKRKFENVARAESDCEVITKTMLRVVPRNSTLHQAVLRGTTLYTNCDFRKQIEK